MLRLFLVLVLAIQSLLCYAFAPRQLIRAGFGVAGMRNSFWSPAILAHHEHEIVSGPKASGSKSPGHPASVWEQLLRRFQGDFDNYNQVVEDRRQGLLPKDGGGHENFHCTLIPVSEKGFLAAFYFDGNPQRIFRFRYYELRLPSSEDDGTVVEMVLHTLHPELEGNLRSQSENPWLWRNIFADFESADDNKVQYLPNCEIIWSSEMDPVQHSYAMAHEEDLGIHAVMVHLGAIVDSTIIPGMKIRILDQLSLYNDTFYINDRGLDPETGAYIYGNQAGVPYRLERVAAFVDGERTVLDESLQWTLGSKWRDEAEYAKKIADIGGPSAQMSRPKSKK